MRISPSVVIFDYGNVLCQSQPAADAEAMAAILDVPLPRFTELYWQFRIEYDAAALAPAAYWNIVAQTASRTLTADQTSELIEIDSRSWSHPAPVMPQWARDIRAAGLRTAILSNMPAPVRDYVLRCPWLPEFDARVFSCDVGVCKPEAEMYRECLLALGGPSFGGSVSRRPRSQRPRRRGLRSACDPVYGCVQRRAGDRSPVLPSRNIE